MPAPQWEERWPGRLEYEFQSLRAAGIRFKVNEAAWSQGVLQLQLLLDIDGRNIRAVATFPDLYPEFRVMVDAEQIGLKYHQNPIGGNVCLLGRGGDQWQPTMTLAFLLTKQMERMLASGRPDADPVAIAAEDPQAEPFGAYYPYKVGSAVLVDGSWEVPRGVRWGRLVLGARRGEPFGPTLRAAVLEVRGEHGKILATAAPAIREQFPERFDGRWIRRDNALVANAPTPAFAEAERILPQESLKAWRERPFEQRQMRVLGVFFPEEVAHRAAPGWGWVFGFRLEEDVKNKKRRRKGAKRIREEFVRALYVGREDLSVRVPSLAPMRDKAICVFGLGTLGAPSALEFARAGAREVRVLDGDHVEPGPIVRWPFGLREVGRTKVDVIKEFIEANYPYTRVISENRRLGLSRGPGEKPDNRMLYEFLSGAALVFDATAEQDAQRALSSLARERGIPYVSVVGRRGGWGGVIFRHLPECTRGCWNCLQWALHDGTIPDAPEDGAGGVQPKGCGDVTFTGTSFDMGTLALDAVRKAVGTLCGPEGAYPDSDWDVAVVSLREEGGSACAPTWRTYALEPHPRCACVPA